MMTDKVRYDWFFQSFKARSEHEIDLHIKELSDHLVGYELHSVNITTKFGGIIDVVIAFVKTYHDQ